MKTIRSSTKNPLTIVVLLIAFLNLSCNQDDFADTSEDKSMNLQKYSDIDVFKGVIFLEGPVANKLEKFDELNFRNYAKNDLDIAKMEKYQNTLIRYIDKSNPNYFAEFRKSISSGDHYQVQETLKDAAKIIQEKTIEMYNLDEDEIMILKANIYEKVNEYENFERLSKKEILSILKEITTDANKSKNSPVGIDLWILAYGAVVVAAVLVVVAFFVVPPDSSDVFNSKSNENNFYAEDFLSEIIVQLEGI